MSMNVQTGGLKLFQTKIRSRRAGVWSEFERYQKDRKDCQSSLSGEVDRMRERRETKSERQTRR